MLDSFDSDEEASSCDGGDGDGSELEEEMVECEELEEEMVECEELEEEMVECDEQPQQQQLGPVMHATVTQQQPHLVQQVPQQ